MAFARPSPPDLRMTLAVIILVRDALRVFSVHKCVQRISALGALRIWLQ